MDRDLDAEVVPGAGMRHSADSDVLTLGVLPDDDQVDPVGVPDLGRDSGEGAHGPDVDREVELLAQADDEPPDQLVVGDVGPAHRPEQNRVGAPDDLGGIGRHG